MTAMPAVDELTVGSVKMHTTHGPMRFDGREERHGNGYLRFASVGDLRLTVLLPEGAPLDEHSLRDCVSDPDVILSVLRSPAPELKGKWARRYKANQAKMDTGTPEAIAEVLRDLRHYDADKGCASAERRMMLRAQDRAVAELSVALGIDFDTAADVVEECFAALAD